MNHHAPDLAKAARSIDAAMKALSPRAKPAGYVLLIFPEGDDQGGVYRCLTNVDEDKADAMIARHSEFMARAERKTAP